MANMKWLAKKFDYTLKLYTGAYVDLATVNYFVDTEIGSDLAAGTSTAPFKTVDKIKSLGALIWKAGLVIMVNGIMTTPIAINYAITIIGCGGGRMGRAISLNALYLSIANVKVENIHFMNYTNNMFTDANYSSYFGHNNLFDQCYISNAYLQFHYSLYHTANFITANSQINGNNNTLYNCTKAAGLTIYVNNGVNNHINNTLGTLYAGVNNILNVNGNYLNPTDYNFSFLTTSPLYRTGTANSIEGVNNHVGCGSVGLSVNATTAAMTAAGGATLTNLTVSGNDLYRTDETINGTIQSSYIDFGASHYKWMINLYNTFEYNFSTLLKSKDIQNSTGQTYRVVMDIVVKYGETTAEVDTCPALLYEYGTIFSISGSGAGRVGNADAAYDPTAAIYPTARYCTILLTFRNI